jgi:hypothetical protein
MPETIRISYCPHCGNTRPHKLVHTQSYLERLWSVSDAKDHIDEEAVSFVAVYQTCNQVLVYGGLEAALEEGFRGADLLWPEVGLDNSVPERIRHIYDEASRIEHIAPNAFAVQIRRALRRSASSEVQRKELWFKTSSSRSEETFPKPSQRRQTC